ncbi:unnamed protein product [Arabidopsis halleri]
MKYISTLARCLIERKPSPVLAHLKTAARVSRGRTRNHARFNHSNRVSRPRRSHLEMFWVRPKHEYRPSC